VIERENEISTAIGFDIAMPHGKSETVLQPFIAFLRTAGEFHWSEENKEEVRLVFLIAVPSENTNNMHLKFISQVSKKLLDDRFRELLLIEEDSNKVYELLKSIQKD
jgi:fructose-specific phosphotransferase system IIA component